MRKFCRFLSASVHADLVVSHPLHNTKKRNVAWLLWSLFVLFIALTSETKAQTAPASITVSGACLGQTFTLNKYADNYENTGRPAYTGVGDVTISGTTYTGVSISVFYEPAGPAWVLSFDGGAYLSNSSTATTPPTTGWVTTAGGIGPCTGAEPLDMVVGDPPTVIINQASGQADPTGTSPIHFTVVFSEAVTGFATGDVTLSGTAGATTATVTQIAPMDGTTFDVAVSGMTSNGTVIATIAADMAIDAHGNGNSASTSTDNTVNWDSDLPPTVVSINRQTPSTSLTNASTVTFRVIFSEDVTGVDAADFELTKTSTANGSINTVTPVDEHTYDVNVNTLTGNGTLRLDLKASGTGIKDKDGVTFNDITGGFTAGQTYTLDHTVPALSSVNISSNNVNSASLAKVGNKVTVLFTSSESIGTPTVTIHGQTATVSNVSGNQWKGEYIMQSSDAPEGTITFSISFTDLAGNIGTNVTATTDASSVTFDKTLPTLTSVHIQSNNANTAKAKVGDIVTVSFTASEPLTSIGPAIDGHILGAVNVSGNDYTFSWTMANGDPEGLVTFSVGFADAAGNVGTIVTATTDASSVTFDRTAPTLSPVTIASNNTNNTAYAKVGNNVTLTFTSSEAIGNPTVTIATHSVTPTNTSGNIWSAVYQMVSGDAEGTVPFTINFSDLTGNAGTQVTATTNASSVTFDKTAPTLTTVTIASNNADPTKAKVGDVVTVNFTSSEPIQMPTATIATNTATISPLGGNNYKATYTMAIADAEGNVPFSISFSDIAGNAGTGVSATTNSSAVSFDRTFPTLTSVHIQSSNTNSTLARIGNSITVSFTSSEPISGTVVTINGLSATVNSAGGNSYTASRTVIAADANGLVTFSINSFKDAAGNTGVAVTATTDGSSVTVDKTAPTLSPVTIASNNTNNTAYAKLGDKVTLLFTASEAIQTPSVSILGHSVTPTVVTGNQWKVEYTTVNTDAEGTIAFLISDPKDLVGNEASSVSATTNGSSVIYDKTAPALTGVCPSNQTPSVGSNCTANVSWTVPTATDANVNSGNSFSAYEHTGGDPGSFGIGTYNIVYKFKDPAGNETICSFTITLADNTPPSVGTLTANPVVIWPPDHKLKDIVLTYTSTDNCTPTANITNNITVTSTDPISGVLDGDKFPDWIVIDDHHVQLRAERGNGREARIYTITVTPVDANGNRGTPQSVQVYIAHNITAPITGTSFKVGSTVNFAGVFWDKPGNKHTATWSIDDNTTVKATVTEPSGPKNGKVTGSYKFTSAGVYRLQMNITDQNRLTSWCNTNEDQEAIVVIYDPNGGYTYGGGYFNSPAGALTSDPSATGKANFGYSLNYYKGATLPKGETQFEFKVGDFQYNALNFDYLSVASPGYKAVFAGSGKIIGGISGVNFTMYVIDGALDGSNVDKVRLKIYNKNTNYVYYDNEPGKSDAANPITPVGVNSDIVIGGSSAIVSTGTIRDNNANTFLIQNLELRTYPNPSHSSFNLVISSTNKNDKVAIKVLDVLGRVIEQKEVSANQTINIGALYKPGIYVVHAIQGNMRRELKLNKIAD